MKHLIFLFIGFCGSIAAAHACPNLSGSYVFAEAPWNGSVEIEQKNCKSVRITHSRNVAVSARYPEGVWIESKNLRVDGRTYVGFTDATEPAKDQSEVFQKTSWEDRHLVIRNFAGSPRKCGYAYFTSRGECHVAKSTLRRADHGDGLIWVQTGVWWNEGGEPVTAKHRLIRKTESDSLPRYASN